MNTPRYHCLFDISCICNDLSDSAYLGRILHDLAHVVEMSILAGPLIAEGHQDNPGLTGIVVVDYSHISIHTFTMHKEALIDIFSCKPYNQGSVKAYIQEKCGTDSSVIREQIVWWGR